MGQFKKQWRGYRVDDVDAKMKELNNLIESKNQEIASLEAQVVELNQSVDSLTKRISVTEKTNEEIARLALKEASELIEKAKRNANMILKESMEYVRSLSKDMDTFKKEAIDFRENVVKMSEDMLETIDKSEIFSLIEEEKENT